ncbi:MAG: hypothetical protein E6G34_08230 [Actinobacteria bacterium]|nr:MAG: hypothetical protein E6G34_08230 [Actinomycetota bacterium]
MSTSHDEERFGDELREVADALRDQRPTLDPLTLDAIKLRAMSRRRRSTSSQAKGVLMRSRLTTLLTVGFLSLGTGGALAVVGGVPPFNSSDEGSASCTQYRPGNGFGDKNHCHTGPPGQTGEKPGNAPGHTGAPGQDGEGHGNGHGH